MSILVTTLFPMILSGALPPPDHLHHQLSAAPAAIVAARPVTAPAAPALIRAPAPAVIPAVIASPAKPAPAVIAPETPAGPVGGELIRVQSPGPSPAPVPASLTQTERNAIVARVGKALSDTKTAQGKFTQVDAWGDPASGVFYISRPGKVRFEYTSPEPMFIVSDGVSVSIEEPKRLSYDAAPLSTTPLHLFLRSNVDLQRDGSVSDVATRNGSHFVTLVDKTGEAEGSMILEFRASDFELLGWRAIDGAGGETRVRLTDTKTNMSLRGSLFIVKDPADDDDRRR